MTNRVSGQADSLRHIAEIAVMEQKLPKQPGQVRRPLLLGRRTSIASSQARWLGCEQDTMTLWDKEDMAVRMVLEEGKLNMCLRVLQGAHGTGHSSEPTGTHSCSLRRTLSSCLTSAQSTKH